MGGREGEVDEAVYVIISGKKHAERKRPKKSHHLSVDKKVHVSYNNTGRESDRDRSERDDKTRWRKTKSRHGEEKGEANETEMDKQSSGCNERSRAGDS